MSYERDCAQLDYILGLKLYSVSSKSFEIVVWHEIPLRSLICRKKKWKKLVPTKCDCNIDQVKRFGRDRIRIFLSILALLFYVFTKISVSFKSKKTYRVYSRISREILDKIWQKFYLFDLYAGHKKVSPKMYQNHFMYVSELSIQKNKALEISNFGHFLPVFFNSNYTRVDLYASIYGNWNQTRNTILSLEELCDV